MAKTFEMQCYLSAFVSASRTVTFSLQAVLKNVTGFDEWYGPHQEMLKSDELARFFQEFRRINQHIGENLAMAGTCSPDQQPQHWFMPTPDIPEVPTDDVFTACREYFLRALDLIYDCYVEFGPEIDEQQRYTAEYFSSIGKKIEDAEEELGFPRGWTDIGDPNSLEYRWQLIRDQSTGCEINDVFLKYLGKTTPIPDRLPSYEANGT